ncbi:MAG: DNA primase [Deltaproteobacteria bacterium]|nr:DNA primase [Deltaproteobacteria bacterium]
MIPQEKIDEIRERANIVQVISDHVTLKKVGRNYVGLCPFHSEKTPSFTVSEEKQIFYCFGCNTGGNVFTFLMRQENLSYPEAVRVMAGRFGIEIVTDRVQPRDEGQRELMFLTNQLASEFYHHELLSSQNAKDYLKKRGIDEDTIRTFRIGYAPKIWDGVVGLMERKGYLELAERVGLVVRKEGGGFYDRFRERIIFPIMDIKGRVTGFGGRTIGEAGPTYLNSPDSPIFKKGDGLYGIYQARGSVSKEGFAVVVEGYFDLLAMHQYGFKNSVATMGTALGQGHLKLLRGCAKEVYILFDSDEPGKKAALRILPLFLDEGVSAKVVLIPEGVDPDEVLNKEGREGMNGYIQKAQPIMDLFIHDIQGRFDIETPQGKVSFLEEVTPYLIKMRNVAERGVYMELVSHMLNLSIDVVAATIKAVSKTEYKSGSAPKEFISINAHRRTEESILKVLLFHPQLYNSSVKEAIEAFRDGVLKEAGMLLIRALSSGKDPLTLLDGATDSKVRDWITKATLNEAGSISENPERILEDSCEKVLARGRIKEETETLRKQMEDAHRAGDTDIFKALAKTYLERKRKGKLIANC